MGLLLAACSAPQESLTPTSLPSATPSATISLTPEPARTLPIWQNYPSPGAYIMPTALPPPAPRVDMPEEVNLLVLLGVDRPFPYQGRTDAILLIFYNPNTARAAVVSIPPDLFVYIPGLTMQRLQIAYVSGGMDLVLTTLDYNLGIRPEQYAVVPMDAFTYLVDSLGGLDITVTEDLWNACTAVRSGVVRMDGQKALCYLRYRAGMDEAGRSLRQQEVFRRLFERLVQSGNLVQLPELYATYKDRVESNLTLEDMTAYVPLTLQLGDYNRIQYVRFSPKAFKTWRLPGSSEVQVFLPEREEIRAALQDAVDGVLEPAVFSERILTLRYALTVSPTGTLTPTRTMTPTKTLAPTRTITLTRTITKTRTVTRTRTATRTATQTMTETPTPP